ncbi:MAG: CBS domain-containing protein [Gammaproteobacteria bacterium]|nr:CBS domain-containing protein [Gammaproteobacteria bacterium]
MKISKLMSSNLVTVAMDDPLSVVKNIFEQTKFHHLVVIDNNKIVGVISDRDLLKSISFNIDSVTATTKDLASLNKKAHQIMSHNPVFLNQDSTVKTAVKIFNDHKISCIPIVNDNEKPVGIISWRDIMQALGRAR